MQLFEVCFDARFQTAVLFDTVALVAFVKRFQQLTSVYFQGLGLG